MELNQPTSNLNSFPSSLISNPFAVASLLFIRREKETQSQEAKVLVDNQISSDGKEPIFWLTTEIDVHKPELLMEEFGILQLF
jgi:hypothetical protein